MKEELDEYKMKVIKLANVFATPEYQRVETNFIQGQQRISQTVCVIESLPLKKEIKDLLIGKLMPQKQSQQ